VLVFFRRVARVLRLALLCLTLAWSSAPAAAAPAQDAIALFVGARRTAAERALAEPSGRATHVRELAEHAFQGESEPRASRFTAPRAWSLPHRLYIEHRSLLC
jgi:hypothetical protein